MFGLAVRWSLVETSPETLQELRDYVATESYPRFAALDGLHIKTWRAREQEWFEGIYVFESSSAREDFQAESIPNIAKGRVSQIVGAGPISVEPFEVLAVVEGPAGFRAGPRFED